MAHKMSRELTLSDKKGQTVNLQNLPLLAGLFIASVITISIGGEILQKIADGQTAGSTSEQISYNGSAGMLEMANFFPTIGLVIGAAVVIGIVLATLVLKNQ